MKALTATQIAERLARRPDLDSFHELTLACDARRVELRARRKEITPSALSELNPAERRDAVLKGPAAVKALDDEVERIDLECSCLSELEREVSIAREKLLDDQARAAIPVAHGKLPGALKRARAALEALNGAISDLNSITATLGQYGRLVSAKYPLAPDELVALLELREGVWTALAPAPLTLPGDPWPAGDEFDRARELLYRERSPGTWITRRRGHPGAHPLDGGADAGDIRLGADA